MPEAAAAAAVAALLEGEAVTTRDRKEIPSPMTGGAGQRNIHHHCLGATRQTDPNKPGVEKTKNEPRIAFEFEERFKVFAEAKAVTESSLGSQSQRNENKRTHTQRERERIHTRPVRLATRLR
jgi:hypothetical protein